MLETIQSVATAYWFIIVPILVTMFLAIPVYLYREKVRYVMMGWGHRFPFFGRLSYWVKHPGEMNKTTHFLKSEEELCDAYYHYYSKHNHDGAFFKKSQDYLMKVNEDNRKEKGALLWVLIMTLMVIEASAFGYALAPYALTLATPNTALASAFGIGLVISVIALLLSEVTGRQLYLNHVIGQIMSYSSIREAGSAGDFIRKDLINIDNTYDDAKRPAYQQMLNRVKISRKSQRPSKSYSVTAMYGVFIVILAVAAFWVRAETLNAMESEVISDPAAFTSSGTDDFPTSEDKLELGEGMNDVLAESTKQSAQDVIDAQHRASLITFGVLSSLFVFIQFTSTYLAYSRGFAGSHSAEAWEQTRRFSNADEYVAHHRRLASSIAVDAQQTLGKLQAMLAAQFHISGNEHNAKESNKFERTFERHVALREIARAAQEIEAMLNGHLSRAEDLEGAGDKEGARQACEMAARMAAGAEPGSISSGLLAKIRVMQSAYMPHQPTSAPGSQEVSAAPTTVEPANSAVAASFDPYAWGKLTGFEEDDMAYVAAKKGVETALLVRAYKLQKLDETVG